MCKMIRTWSTSTSPAHTLILVSLLMPRHKLGPATPLPRYLYIFYSQSDATRSLPHTYLPHHISKWPIFTDTFL